VDGGYAGTYARPVPAGFEALPLILDIPKLTLKGTTVLQLDEAGLPTGFVSGTETRLVASPRLTGAQLFIVIGPTPLLDARDVTVEGFVLDGGTPVRTTGIARGIGLTRAQGASIIGNFITGLTFGIYTDASSYLAKGNFMTGVFAANNAGAGNSASPAHARLIMNRLSGNGAGAIFAGTALLEVFDPTLLPIPSDTIWDHNSAELIGNDLSDNTVQRGFSSGIRFFTVGAAPGPGKSATGNITAKVVGNRVNGNSIGIVVDAGFPTRGQGDFTGSFSGTFEDNEIVGNDLAPIEVTFTRVNAATDLLANHQNRAIYTYMKDSNYQITAPDGEFDCLWHDNPATDWISGVVLNNTLTINGVPFTGSNIILPITPLVCP
jgi:hypothetical protein